MKFKYFHIILIVLLALTGCTSPRIERELKDKPLGFAYKPDNIYAAESLPAGFRRVVVLPLSKKRLAHDLSEGIETAMVNSLRRQARFEVVVVDPDELYELLGNDNLTFDRPIPEELLQSMKSTYGADGILQTEITAFRPYKPMQLGIRARLFTGAGDQVLWSCDEIFDAGNQDVLTGARMYAEKEIEQPYPLQSSYSAVISPQRFAAYVGQILFQTLPHRILMN